jgi:hypothetical protein
MQQPDDKLDFSAISFDDVIGDGAEGIDSLAQDDGLPPVDKEELPKDDDLDSDSAPKGEDDPLDGVDDDPKDDPKDDPADKGEPDDDSDDDLEGGDTLSVANQISEVLGFEPGSEYEDTVEGLTEFVRDMSSNVAESQLQDLFKQHPDIQKHLDYVLSGGDSKQFFQANATASDFESLKISENDIRTQRDVLSQYFETKGHDKEFINDLLEDYEDSGKLFTKSQAAKTQLSNLQKQQREEMVITQQEQHKSQQEEQTKFWDDVANTLEEGKEFGGVKIPDREKANFFKYISTPIDKSGKTQRDADYGEADMDIKLAIDYLMYSGFDLNGIINTKAKTASARSLRDRIVKNESNVKNAKGAQRRKQQSFNSDNLDITALF